MEDDVLPKDVLQFLTEQIDSVPHLEALLLLWESGGRRWSEPEIAARIYIDEATARRVLHDLAQRQLIVAEPGAHYVYELERDKIPGLLPRVATTYRRHLIRVAKIIHAKASPGVQEFARAFQLKKKDD